MLIHHLIAQVVSGTDMTPAMALSMLVSVVIPLLVGLVTKLNASSGLKGALNAVLAAATAVITDYLAHPKHVAWYVLVLNIGINFAISEASYYGIWKATGVSSALQQATAGFGIGGSSGSTETIQAPQPYVPSVNTSPTPTYPGTPMPVSNVPQTSPPVVVPPPDGPLEPTSDEELPEG